MTFARDQKQYADGLSETSCRMLALRDQVFLEWEARVRAGLEPASTLSRPLLIDSLPAFYNNIAEALTPGYPRNSAVDGTTLAAEHGGERARLTNYDHPAIVGEYQKLRWVIFDVLNRHGVRLAAEDVQTINSSIDSGIKEAVGAFALVNSMLRERFAAALAHDLRTPLGVTSTALELILMTDDLAKTKTLAVKALENVRRMDHMLHELLDTMAFHSGEQLSLVMSNFDIYGLVKEVIVARSGVRMKHVDLIGTQARGWWDRSAITRAVENLLSNAEKYGSGNTPITITIDAENERMALSVHNDGPPIPAEQWEDVFQMYRRTQSAQSSREGWGIGLPYVRAVAESHGGNIELDSSAERGTTFVIDLPTDCRPYLGAATVA